MTSMGNIDQGATKFLNSLKKRDPFKVKKLMDLISVQHAKWIAVRLRKCLGFHSKTMEASAGKMYLQPPKGPKHDRSKQGKKGEFARLASVLSQPGSQSQQSGEHTAHGSRARFIAWKNPPRERTSKADLWKTGVVRRVTKFCASPLHGEDSGSTEPAFTTQQTVEEELRAEGHDGALEVLAVMRSLDDERDPVSQDNNFSRGIDRAQYDYDGAFSPSRAFYNSPA